MENSFVVASLFFHFAPGDLPPCRARRRPLQSIPVGRRPGKTKSRAAFYIDYAQFKIVGLPMHNTHIPSPTTQPVLSVVEGPAVSPAPRKDTGSRLRKRKRGAQPGNTNARVHGLYAAVDSHPAAQLIQQAAAISAGSPAIPDAEVINTQIHSLRLVNLGLLEQKNKTTHDRTKNALIRHLIRNCATIGRLYLTLYAPEIEKHRLRSLAKNAHVLNNWEFRKLRIPANPVFVPHSFGNLSHLSTYCGGLHPSGAFLTDRHWFLIEPLIAALRQEQTELARLLGKRYRRSQYPDRFLLDGVLWKLATACNWDELPPEYPLRSCQRLYRQLYNTGRMAAIYEIIN